MACKRYAASIQASRRSAQAGASGIEMGHVATVVDAVSRDEAVGRAVRVCRETIMPESDGWGEHAATVVMIRDVEPVPDPAPVPLVSPNGESVAVPAE